MWAVILVAVPQFAFAEAEPDFSGYFSGGDGSADNPFLIADEVQLRHIEYTKILDKDDEFYYIDYSFKLVNDIVLTNQWLPITSYFRGIFDGNNKTIFNMSFYATNYGEYYGFFSNINQNGIVKNINFSGAKIESRLQDNSTVVFAGIIAGKNNGKIQDCTVTNSYIVIDSYVSSAGGIAGVLYSGIIVNCSSYVDVTGTGKIGGIVGTATVYATINDCRNSGTITYKYDTVNGCAGGIAGELILFANITDCINYGKIVYGSAKNVSSKIKPYMAQIVGLCNKSSVINCDVKGSTDYTKLCSIVPKQTTYCSVGAIGLEIKGE